MSIAKRRNSISGQFAARTIEMLESPAYRVLSRSAHMVISRVEIELAHHGGNDNGRLPITTEDFIAYGMDRSSVAQPSARLKHSASSVLSAVAAVTPSTARRVCLDR